MLLFIAENTVEKENLKHFNTSHVTVYHKGTQLRKEQTKNFNTSHVTVYRRHTGNDHPVSEFQYISCYCLSPSGCTTLVAVAPFQYISCYCLSVIRIAIAGADGYFNTSHVTVYLSYPII